MANKITHSEVDVKNFVDSTSRYRTSKVFYYGENNIITLETYKRELVPENSEDRYMVITKGLEYRPDLVSIDVYGTVNFWWKILIANGMMDIYEFKVGTNIRIPSVTTIFS